ncbi:hypothetical protein ACKWTF_001033 [Chironomus riparius]
MKVLKLLIIASIITYAAARVLGPQTVEARRKTKLQSKQDDEPEGVDVDSDIPVANIQVYEVSSSTTSASAEDVADSVETSVAPISAETTVTSAESTEATISNEDDSNPINRYCKCTSFECDCCRDFALPLVPIRGPGCANIRYLEGDRLSVGIKFGNRVLANRIVNGRKATPVCLPLPGGFTNFCGRIYGISKKNENFKACLGLELRADDEVEAALRVSCFDFGPRGLKVTDAEPLPPVPAEDEDDDDDDDLFGFGGGDDDDDDDDILGDDDDSDSDDDRPTGQSANPQPSAAEDDDDDDADYTGFSLLSGDFLDDILGGDDDDSSVAQPQPARKNPKRKQVKPQDNTNVENNEVDGVLDDEETEELVRPVQADSSDDEEDDDEEDGGIFGILDDLISDGDDEEESAEEQLEDEVSEEIVQNELEDDAEDVAEEVDDVTGSVKDADLDNENDLEDQALEEAVVDDGN